MSYGPLGRQQPWNRWWVILWAINVAGMVGMLVAAVPFVVWMPLAGGSFFAMEARGLLNHDDGYPPLTEVCREYIPRWMTFLLIYGVIGLGAGTFFHVHHRWWLAALGGLGGWLVAHFDITYDEPAIAWEQAKYRWWHCKLVLGHPTSITRVQRDQCVGRTLTCVQCGEGLWSFHKPLCRQRQALRSQP